MSMAVFARTIQPLTGRTVIDRSSLSGAYAFSLTFSPRLPGPPTNPDAADAAPDVFAALPEQLGLRLESARGPVDVLIIEHIERPTEN
jgi:uncharacterized protein (TIGR03435 family)